MNLDRLKSRLRHTWIFPRYIDRRCMHKAIGRAATKVGGTVIDIGCGMRQYEYLFSHAKRYVGLDRPRTSEQARADVVADGMVLPFAQASVDCVLLTEVIEHVPDHQMLLAEIARVIRPGGTLIMSAPFIGGLHEEPRDYYRFTPYIVKILLDRYGFTVEEISSRGGWWTVVLGSFVVQALYDWVNPASEEVPGGEGGERDYSRFRRSDRNIVRMALMLPACAVLQMIAYGMDRIFNSPRYTLGYVVSATRAAAKYGPSSI